MNRCRRSGEFSTVVQVDLTQLRMLMDGEGNAMSEQPGPTIQQRLLVWPTYPTTAAGNLVIWIRFPLAEFALSRVPQNS